MKHLTIFFILSIFLIKPTYGQTNTTEQIDLNITAVNQNDSVFSNLSTSALFEQKAKFYNEGDINYFLLRSIEQEREFLAQKQKTYDTFLKQLTIYISIFTVFITIVLAALAFIGYRSIRELKGEVREDLKGKVKDQVGEMAKYLGKTEFGARIEDIDEKLSNLEADVMDLQDDILKVKMLSESEAPLKPHKKEIETEKAEEKKESKKSETVFD